MERNRPSRKFSSSAETFIKHQAFKQPKMKIEKKITEKKIMNKFWERETAFEILTVRKNLL